MPDAQAATRRVGFGDLEVDLRAGEVHRSGSRIVLADQPLRILVRLLERPGEVVLRDELRHELWPDNTFVDFEHGLNSAIKRLRDVLGDSAETPRYIETLPRRGYRFMAPIDSAPLPNVSSPGGRTAPTWGRPRATALRLTTAAILLASVGLIAGWLVLTSSRSGSASSVETPGPPPAPVVANRVAVVAFENRTADPSFASLGQQAAHRMIRAISRLETVEIVPEAVRAEPGGDTASDSGSDDPAAAAVRAGAGLAVAGAYYLESDRLEFQARILDARSGQPLYFAPPITGISENPADALKQLEQAVAGAVAIHFDPAFGGLHLTAHPPLLDAYLEYDAGRVLFERDYPRLVGHMERALTISPRFLQPRLLLAMANDNLGDRERVAVQMARIAEGADGLTRAESLLVEYLTESLARRPADALRALYEVEKLAPDSWIVNYSIQMEALILNRPGVAIDAFARLPLDDRRIHHRSNAWRLNALARALHEMGDYERELKEVKRAQVYQPGNLRYVAGETRALAGLGRLDDIHRVIEAGLSVPASAGSPGGLMEIAALELRAHRHREASIAVAARAVDWFRSRPDAAATEEANRAALARMLYLSERWNEAYALFADLAAAHPRSVEYAGFLGAVAARQGKSRDALDISERLRRLATPDAFGRPTYWRACIAALLGEQQRAVDLLREAVGQGQYMGRQLHQSADLEPLRDFPPFIELVAPKH